MKRLSGCRNAGRFISGIFPWLAGGFAGLACFVTVYAASCMAGPKELKAAVGLALPPYNIQETDSGIEMDIVREALKAKGYSIRAVYVPFARVIKDFKNNEVDAALTTNPDSGLEAFYSDEHLICQNVVVTLKQNHLQIRTVNDLENHSVLAFQGATLYLSKNLASMAGKNPQYKEIANQELQINLLYSNRVDAIVMDRNIFYYFREHAPKVDTSLPIDVWDIFPPTAFRVAFRDKQARDDFNEGLRQLRESGRMDAIIRKYIAR